MLKTTAILALVATLPVAAIAATSALRSDGTVLVDGAPFFPMGFYNINSVADMKNVAQYGFNCSWTRAQDVSNFGQFLDSCGTHDFKVIVACASEDVLGEGLVAAHKNKSGVFSWDVEDDAEDPTYRTYDQVKAKSETLWATDQTHARYISLTANSVQRRAEVRRWVEIVEMSGIQMYPIGEVTWDRIDQTQALRVCAQRMAYYVDSARVEQRSIIGNLQSYSWGSRAVSNGRYPTAAEIRAMTYAGLVAGLKGIVYYTYSGITGVSEHWNELKLLAADVSLLAPTLMDGAWSRVATGDQDVFAAIWVYRDTVLAIATNTSYTQSKSISVTLPSGFSATPTSVHSRLATGFAVQTGRLTGTLGTTGVVAVRIARDATGNKRTELRLPHGSRVNAHTTFDIAGRTAPSANRGVRISRSLSGTTCHATVR